MLPQQACCLKSSSCLSSLAQIASFTLQEEHCLGNGHFSAPSLSLKEANITLPQHCVQKQIEKSKGDAFLLAGDEVRAVDAL